MNLKNLYLRRNLLETVKNWVCAVNLDEYKSIGTKWIALHMIGSNTTYVNSFGVQHIPKEIKNFIINKNITNIFKMLTYYFIIYGYIQIGFICFISKGKSLTDHTNLFSPENLEQNNNVFVLA